MIAANIFFTVIDFAYYCILASQLMKISANTLCISPVLNFSDHAVYIKFLGKINIDFSARSK